MYANYHPFNTHTAPLKSGGQDMRIYLSRKADGGRRPLSQSRCHLPTGPLSLHRRAWRWSRAKVPGRRASQARRSTPPRAAPARAASQVSPLWRRPTARGGHCQRPEGAIPPLPTPDRRLRCLPGWSRVVFILLGLLIAAESDVSLEGATAPPSSRPRALGAAVGVA